MMKRERGRERWTYMSSIRAKADGAASHRKQHTREVGSVDFGSEVLGLKPQVCHFLAV